MLLILDNFEHLLPAATQVSELLAAAPYLKVLATSREPLHLYGEQEYAVPPLALPDPEHLDPSTLADCESTALFMQGARAVRSDFELTAENAADVAQICFTPGRTAVTY
jgi:predicted ATPase